MKSQSSLQIIGVLMTPFIMGISWHVFSVILKMFTRGMTIKVDTLSSKRNLRQKLRFIYYGQYAKYLGYSMLLDPNNTPTM